MEEPIPRSSPEIKQLVSKTRSATEVLEMNIARNRIQEVVSKPNPFQTSNLPREHKGHVIGKSKRHSMVTSKFDPGYPSDLRYDMPIHSARGSNVIPFKS